MCACSGCNVCWLSGKLHGLLLCMALDEAWDFALM